MPKRAEGRAPRGPSLSRTNSQSFEALTNYATLSGDFLKEMRYSAVQSSMSASAIMVDPEELIPTRDSLLSRLKDRDDHDSWQDFFNTYWKLVYGVAMKAGLTDQEAQEVVQETVITVSRRIAEFKYDPAICS